MRALLAGLLFRPDLRIVAAVEFLDVLLLGERTIWGTEMKARSIACGVLMALAAGSLPGGAAAATKAATCSGFIDGNSTPVEITGNLVVPPGALCVLLGDVTVDGNVSVGAGANFDSVDAHFARNFSTEEANTVILVRTEVDGNASIDATRGVNGCGANLPVCVTGSSFPGTATGVGTKFGNLSITNTAPGRVDVAGNFVAHDLTCTANSQVSAFGNPNTVLGLEFGQCVGL